MAAKKSGIETADVLIADLTPYPGNPKTHDLDTIRESLESNGQYRAIVVRKADMLILAGHGTVEAAEQLEWEKITAHLIECDDDTARRIVLVDNRAPEKGGYDEPALAALLKKVPDFQGTGFAGSDLARLASRLAPPSSEPQRAAPTWEIIVEVDGETAQADLLDRLASEGFKCRALL